VRTFIIALGLALVLFAGTQGQGPAAEPTPEPPVVEYVNAPPTGAPCEAPC
jgi:hypothetical protein